MTVIIIRDNELRKKLIVEARRLNIDLDKYVENMLRKALDKKDAEEADKKK